MLMDESQKSRLYFRPCFVGLYRDESSVRNTSKSEKGVSFAVYVISHFVFRTDTTDFSPSFISRSAKVFVFFGKFCDSQQRENKTLAWRAKWCVQVPSASRILTDGKCEGTTVIARPGYLGLQPMLPRPWKLRFRAPLSAQAEL